MSFESVEEGAEYLKILKQSVEAWGIHSLRTLGLRDAQGFLDDVDALYECEEELATKGVRLSGWSDSFCLFLYNTPMRVLVFWAEHLASASILRQPSMSFEESEMASPTIIGCANKHNKLPENLINRTTVPVAPPWQTKVSKLAPAPSEGISRSVERSRQNDERLQGARYTCQLQLRTATVADLSVEQRTPRCRVPAPIAAEPARLPSAKDERQAILQREERGEKRSANFKIVNYGTRAGARQLTSNSPPSSAALNPQLE
jgi:hypothetical protein